MILMAKVYQMPEGKKVIINNFLKHFLVTIIITLGFIFMEWLVLKSITVTDELIVFLILLGGDLLAAGIKALEEWNEEWAEKFQWFIVPLKEFIVLAFKKLIKKTD